jgi:hypothetical protein
LLNHGDSMKHVPTAPTIAALAIAAGTAHAALDAAPAMMKDGCAACHA